MLVILPLLVWVALAMLWLGRKQGSVILGDSCHSIRSAIILASICWGAGLALITELLSMLHALTSAWVGLVWFFALILTGVFSLRGGYFQRGLHRLAAGWSSLQKGDFWLGSTLAGLSGVLLLVLLISPSNNTDSFLYHLSRIMHWVQNGSLQHYATATVQQLYNPIWAEEVILHLRLLWGGDRLAGLVQWCAMLASLAAITQIASELGVGKRGQWITAAFAFSLPTGVLQSVSTQNDYVVTFWLVCVAWLCLRATIHVFGPLEALVLGLAVGLGLLTKGTFYPYAAPFGLWFLIAMLRHTLHQPDRMKAFQRTLLVFGIIFFAVILLNCGYWLRNFDTFNNPLGPQEWLSHMSSGQFNIEGLFGSTIGYVVLNFATPSEQINDRIVTFFRTRLAQIDSRLSGFWLFWGWNNEDLAGNPMHFIILVVVVFRLLIARKRIQDRRLWVYLASIVGAYIIFALTVHFDIFGVRYLVPLFVLSAPLVGTSAELFIDFKQESRAGITTAGTASRNQPVNKAVWLDRLRMLAGLLLLTSLPWILINRGHPLLALKDGGEPFSIPCQPVLGCTAGSILFEPRMTSLFANYMNLRDPYVQMSKDLQRTSCQQIGLWTDSRDLEYLFWWLLDAPQSEIHLESLYTFPELERYIDPEFQPCAIICTICGDRTRLHGLSLEGDYSVVRLYTGSGFTHEPGPKD